MNDDVITADTTDTAADTTQDQENAAAAQAEQSTETADETVSEAVADELDGYTLVGSTNVNHDDGESRIVFDDLLPAVKIEHATGVSVALDQPAQNSNHGTLRARLIHDNGGRAYIYRKDADGVTTFKVAFRYMSA